MSIVRLLPFSVENLAAILTAGGTPSCSIVGRRAKTAGRPELMSAGVSTGGLSGSAGGETTWPADAEGWPAGANVDRPA
jgi:hypothetical protein